MSAPTLATRARRRAAGVVVMLTSAMLVLTGCGSILDLQLPGGVSVGDNPMTVHVEFRDVLDLVPQTTVKVDDVSVGRVTGIKLKGYTADVTLLLPHDLELPDNARAEIRQTSLLGEKFVSLAPPDTGASSNRLRNGDVIPLSRSGRNPEVEEVLGALSLLLNGGGVGQLKTIAAELNNALGGRESDVRSVLDQIHFFVGQLDANKQQIVSSIESLNRLAIQLRKQDGSIKSALDNLPAAIKSVDSQRKDLVKVLRALSKLSGVGVQVIRASKQATINSLKDLAPVLSQLAAAGEDFPKSLQVLLTFPFVDAAVGRDPQVARNLHMGDFTNLSANLNIDLTNLPSVPGLPLPSVSVPTQIVDACKMVKKQVKQATDTAIKNLPNSVLKPLTGKNKKQIKKAVVARVLKGIDCKNPGNIPTKVANALLDILKNGAPGLPKLPISTKLPTKLPIPVPIPGGLGLGRAGTSFDRAVDPGRVDILNGPAGTADQLGYNSTLAALLLQGVKG